MTNEFMPKSQYFTTILTMLQTGEVPSEVDALVASTNHELELLAKHRSQPNEAVTQLREQVYGVLVEAGGQLNGDEVFARVTAIAPEVKLGQVRSALSYLSSEEVGRVTKTQGKGKERKVFYHAVATQSAE